MAVTTAVPDVKAEQRARTAANPATFIWKMPAAVAVDAKLRVDPALAPLAIADQANQLVPSTVASNVRVAVNVPVMPQATEAVS